MNLAPLRHEKALLYFACVGTRRGVLNIKIPRFSKCPVCVSLAVGDVCAAVILLIT